MQKNRPKRLKRLLLTSQPKPLYSHDHKIALFFSAKAGCTFAVKWYLFQINLLDAAMFYHPWVHRFRIDVFYKSKGYRHNLYQMLNPSCRIFKFVRNPYSRAVSSYIHAVKCGYENENISKFLNRDVNSVQGYSFEDFLSYLESINLKRCNPHHRLQIHEAEIKQVVKINHLIRIEESGKTLPAAEEKLGLKQSNLGKLTQSSHHTHRAEKGDLSNQRAFTSQEFEDKLNLPPTRCFYDKSTQDRVLELYRLDFRAYGYDTSVLP